MAEVRQQPAPAHSSEPGAGSGFELRLERGGASVRLADRELAPGLTLECLTLRVPDVHFPFDAGAGAAQFRSRLTDLVELRVALTPAPVEAALARAGLGALGLEGVRIAFREGFAELAGRISAGPAFTLQAGLLPRGERGLGLVFHSPRIYGPAPLPAAALPHLAARALEAAGAAALPSDPLAPLLRAALAPRGWKLPRPHGARLSRAAFAAGVAHIAWEAAAGPAETGSAPDLLAADEGARAFAPACEALARGEPEHAREALLAQGSAAASHPFAAELLLSLFLLEDRFHDEALDLAAAWLQRRPDFAPALLAEALVRQARGEPARAAHAFSALAAAAGARGEAFAALAGAEAVFGLAGADPADALRAAEVALEVRRDHVPALRALRGLSAASGDREALVRADRRLVAYDPDPQEKARAHAELGELLLHSDPAAARLHLDQALRLAPEDPAPLAALARACAAAGEPLRAVRALDRLKDVHLARGDRAAAAAAALEAGAAWEGPLAHAENALLRYRAAAELAPGPEVHARAARAAEALGHWDEAADFHALALAGLDAATPGGAALAVRTRLALAGVAERRLGDPAAAAAHLEAAAALAPEDAAVLERLVERLRGLGRPAALAGALDRRAGLEPDAGARAALLAEAGAALRAAGQDGEAARRFAAALALDAGCAPALSGQAELAAARGDAASEREALERLRALTGDAAAAAALDDRIAAAAERAGDLAAALAAAAAARAARPDPARLAAELRLARRVADATTVAELLAESARLAAAAGDAPTAAAAWLERGRLLVPVDPPAALAALAEARAAAPGDPAVLRAQADAAAHAGDARLALGALRALLAGGAADAAELELRAARAALDAGEPSAAREHAERAHALEARGAGALLAEVLAATGDDAARAALLERLGRWLEAAELHARAGDLPRALAACERAADDPATAQAALARLAELRAAGGDARGASRALLLLARLTGGREGATLALRAHGLDPAGEALDLAAQLDPAFAPARARRAAGRVAEDPRGALGDAEAALAGEALPAADRAGLLALAAAAAAACGDADAARRHLTAYCEAVPGDDTALARLAGLHRRAGDAAGLEAALRRRLPLARGADAAAVRAELGALLAGRGEAAEAARLAGEAIEFDPGCLAALRVLCAAPCAGALAPARALDLLGRLAAHPLADAAEAATAQAGRARLLAAAGDLAGALDAARAAAGAGDDDAALELRAELAARAGAPAEAARALLARARRARDRGEADAGDRLAEAGLALLAAGGADDAPGAEAALREALALAPGRESARAALAALAERARGRGDAAAERDALAALVPLLPTGARPAAHLRRAALAAALGDRAGALAAAEEARALAPRDPAAVEAARAAAEAAGDLGAVADRLEELAALEPASAGRRRLERAGLLTRLGRAAEADAAYAAAIAALPPDRGLAEEHAAFRRARLPARSAAEPLEAYARRAPAPREAARALRAAAALALAQGDLGGAIRAARRAYARTQDDLAFAAPLLARVLYLGGASGEALVVHRRLLEAGLGALPPEDALALARQLAELAEDRGERALALAALTEVLARRPQDLDAAVRRLALDEDPERGARAVLAAAEAARSGAARADALGRAATALLAAGRPELARDLYRRARAEAAADPVRSAALAGARAEALARAGAPEPERLDALGEAADLALDAGEPEAARRLLADAVVLARALDRPAEAARLSLQLDALAAAAGDFAAAAAHARAAGALLLDAGDPAGAAEALDRAVAAAPGDAEGVELLERAARALGDAGGPHLARALAARAAAAAPGPARAAALVALADVHAAAGATGDAEAALREALAHDRASAAARERLTAILTATGRDPEVARMLLDRAAREADPALRARMRRDAVMRLAASPDPADRARAAEACAALATEGPADPVALRAAAALLRDLGRREEAIPLLAALVRADPDDEDAARELADAYADRHLERAELFLGRAAHARGPARAARLREAARALHAAGEDERARAALRDAFDAWPADDGAFVAALREAAAEPERLDGVLSARAAAVPAEAASCHRARADALLAFGEGERAAAAYEAALAAAPGDVETLAALAACLAATRGPPAAAELDRRLVAGAEEARGAVPASAEAAARYRLGLAAWAEGRASDGIAHLERALALAPGDERAGIAWAALAHGHAALGDADLALAAARSRAERALALGLAEERRVALEAAAELAETLGDAGRDAADLLEALLQLRAREGEGPGALAALAGRAAAALDAAGAPARAREARALGGLEPAAPDAAPPPAAPPAGAREAARAAAERALSSDDPAERAEAFTVAAEALARAGAPDEEVRGALELAAGADPDAPGPWRARARLEAAWGEPLAAARALLSASIRSDGDEAARSALEAARLFEDAGAHGDAARAYRAAVLARPGCVPARTVLAEEALAAGDPGAAVEHLRAIPEAGLAPDARTAHRRRLARALDAAGRADEAEALYAELLAADPGDPEAFERAAALALARGALDAWLDLAQLHEQALAAWGQTARRRDLRQARGDLFASAGHLDAARGAFLSVLELDPVYPPALDALAALDGRRDGWAEAAAGLAAEAGAAADPAEAAALHLRRARILLDRLGDEDAAAAALHDALASARESGTAAALRGAEEAEALLAGMGRPAAAAAAEPGEVHRRAPAADPVAEVLRAQAAVAEGVARAELLERLAGHLERAGDAAGAADALLEALEADPERDLTWSWLLSVAAGDPARLARAEAIRARSAAPAPELPPPAGWSDEEIALAAEAPGALPATPAVGAELGPDHPLPVAELAARGRACLQAAEWEPARAWLAEALARDPSDLTLARDLSRAAEKLGRFDDYVRLGEACADAIAAYDPLAAAARLRHFAELLRTRLADPERAAVMLEKALSLVPDDLEAQRELLVARAARPETQARAAEGWLELARRDPSDATALAEASALCADLAAAERTGADASARLAERARLAASLAAFADPSRSAPGGAPVAAHLPAALRERVAAPGANGPCARLLSLLAPWLEPLFPADLAARGAGPADRLAPAAAPALHAALERAARALEARPHAALLGARPGREVVIENTRPPSVVLPAGLADLPEGALAFLAARTLDLVEHGWALLGKFAPRDAAILLELACRFGGGAPPAMGLPAAHAGAFLAALERTVPGEVSATAAALAGPAAAELRTLDPRALAAAVRRTANRVGLLHAGDPGHALRTLALLDRRLDGGPLDPAEALALPDLRDLALLALSDPFVELRLAVLG
ncbi:hypothetical protein [Anaeromyxobacter dehalogenans]|uniref:Uncharacterized protein n=1 Tax=Anaeromyxobacter dehalogenans (strain 2CP-C) TaxID=290397 RepID=Q2IG57_ANADE|nr:hypothetical protein [Anaeromyxobacter dehalogenans]ABC83563.1 hypothetical protein Adeh_3797 [Anaeromyxobacter dehalogenans 2CP-C]